VMLEGWKTFEDWWPALAGDLMRRGLRPYSLPLAGGRVELWLMPRQWVDAATGLPCVTTP
jgi:hypothetical protein